MADRPEPSVGIDASVVPALRRSRRTAARPSAPNTLLLSANDSSIPSGRDSSTCAPYSDMSPAAARTRVRVSEVGVRMPLSSWNPTRSVLKSMSPGSPSGIGTMAGATLSGPARIGSNKTKSSTYLPSGPICWNASCVPPNGKTCPVRGTRPWVGLIPAMPLKCAGSRMLPP